MKASKMTNEELAARLEVHAVPVMGCVGSSKLGREIVGDIREAAARLRAFSTLTTHTDNSEVIAELQRRLKVAEGALEKCVNYNNAWELEAAEENAKNALATIRGEGGAK